MPKKFYLETSAIRSRLIGHSLISEQLKQSLRNQTKVTSKFVKMEFERSLIYDLIEFYFILKNQKYISDAIKYWNEDFRTRKIKNINIVISDMFFNIENFDVNLGLLRLRSSIKSLLIEFKYLIQRYDKNSTNCYLGNYDLNFNLCKKATEFEKEFVTFHDFYKENYIDKCKLSLLFFESKDLIDKIIEHSSKNRSFNKQLVELIKIRDNIRKLSCSTCKIIGDLIVTLECPSYAILLTLDTVFEELCKILSLKFEIIPNIRALQPLNSFKKE